MKSLITTFLSSAHHYVIGIPIAFLFMITAYLAVVWMAISRKDEVEASAWHRDTGFSIKVRNRMPRRRD
jgi:hypothetical protein